jgi:hypothetical protein
MDDMMNSVDTMRILIMNVEAFSTEKGAAFAKLFLRVTKCFMAIDESTTIKTHTAKRTKSIADWQGGAVSPYCHRFPRH